MSRVGVRPRPAGKNRGAGRALRARRPAVAPEQDGRQRILAAAIRAFSELGYAGATTAGIARAAGVAQPLVHHHFGSKDGLWRAAIDSVFSQIPSMPGGDLPPRGTLMVIVEQFVRFVA